MCYRWTWTVTNDIRARQQTVCQQGRWVHKGVDCEIPHQLERGTKHSECENLSLIGAF